MRSATLAAVTLLAVVGLSGCSAQPPGADVAATSRTTAPTRTASTITNCGQQHTYTAPPQRVLLGAPGIVDTLDALGVGDTAVGTALDDLDEGEIAAHPRLRQNTKDWTPSKEYLLATHPDLFIANDQQQLTGDGAASQQDLQTAGGALYVLGDYCLDAPAAPSIDTAYTDITHLGAIYGIPGRAAALNARLQREVATATAHADAAGTTAAAVTIADGEVYALTGAGYQAVLDRLGVTNVFRSTKSNYAQITKEAVLAADPDVIFVVSSDRTGDGDAQAKQLFPRAAATRDGRVYWQDENAYQSGGVRLIATLRQAADDLAAR